MSSDTVEVQVKFFRVSVLPIIPSLHLPTPHWGPRASLCGGFQAGITSMPLPRGLKLEQPDCPRTVIS